MLVSKFNLSQGPEEEEEHHPEHAAEAATEEEAVDLPDDRLLNKSEICVNLSLLGKTADGDGYTYLKATCTGLKVTNIRSLLCFKHVQFVNVSDNCLDLEALQVVTELPFLVLIQADRNRLTSAALKRAKYLQVMILNNNKITSVHDVYQPELSTLEVGYNNIETVHFDAKMPTLKCLDFRNNLLREITNFEFPNLDSLYLAGNKIHSLVGLDGMVNLRILHLRNNPIRFLNGFTDDLKKLMYVNLRNCKVGTLRQVKKLRVLPALEALVLKGCPYFGGSGREDPEVADEEEDPELRVEVLAALGKLKRLNKAIVSPEEKREAKDLMLQWLEEGEKDEEEEVDEAQPEHEEESHVED